MLCGQELGTDRAVGLERPDEDVSRKARGSWARSSFVVQPWGSARTPPLLVLQDVRPAVPGTSLCHSGSVALP